MTNAQKYNSVPITPHFALKNRVKILTKYKKFVILMATQKSGGIL